MESKINVSVRVKPLLKKDSVPQQLLWQQVSDQALMNLRSKELFAFDRVYSGEVTTQQIFDSQMKETVHSALKGINQTVFAYGQTSSGKTFTMRGGKEAGLIPLSIKEIFDVISQDRVKKYTVKVSYLEVSLTALLQLYNECINDLIVVANKNLEVRESITNGIYINRLSENSVDCYDQVIKLLDQGDEARNVAETKLNEASSRSHTVFRISLESTEDGTAVRQSQLNLVDLAGSEGVSKTQADGLRLREGSNINRSLLALSNVINKLSQGSKQFINFRDSKLTRILQKSLGGNSSTSIICTVTQTVGSFQETMNTLLFGLKAKHVKTTFHVNETMKEIDNAQKVISELQNKLKTYQMNDEMGEGSQGIKALQEQIQFLTRNLVQYQQDLSQKEQLIEKIEIEKRSLARQLETSELSIQQLRSNLSLEDGVQLMDLKFQDFDDLRMSISPDNQQALVQLDLIESERDQLKLKIQDIQRDHLNQTFEMNLNMKEEIETIREESLIKSEQLQTLERKYTQLQIELAFYKTQNDELILKVDQLEMQPEDKHFEATVINEMNHSHQQTTRMLKRQNEAHLETITRQTIESKALEEKLQSLEQAKQQLEYNCKAAEYNVEILKNKLENVLDEQLLSQKLTEKLQGHLNAVRQLNQRLRHDLEYFKKGKRPPQQPKLDLNSSAFLDMSLSHRQSISPSELSFGIEMKDSQVQTEPDDQEQTIQELSMMVKQFEVQLTKTPLKQSSSTNEQIKKLRFDNQILMQRLGEYKKAEKGAKDLCEEYEAIKLKYFNVLTETEKQKCTIQELFQTLKQKDEDAANLQIVTQQLTAELIKFKKGGSKQIQALQQEFQLIKCQLLEKQSNADQYLVMMAQAARHLQTVLKHHRDTVSRTEDPVTIEHTLKQTKSIEKLYADLKRAIKQSGLSKMVSDTDYMEDKPILHKRTYDQSKSTDCDDLVRRRQVKSEFKRRQSVLSESD